MIESAIDEQAVLEKTRELCALILGQPKFKVFAHDVRVFLDDKDSQEQYRTVSRRGRELQQLQGSGQPIGEPEIKEFEKMRYDLLNNPVASAFIEAQTEMNQIQEKVNRWLSKSFELGRVPEEKDFECDENGGCGSGCGCKH